MDCEGCWKEKTARVWIWTFHLSLQFRTGALKCQRNIYWILWMHWAQTCCHTGGRFGKVALDWTWAPGSAWWKMPLQNCRRLSAKLCSSGILTLEVHPVHHIVEDLHRFGSLSVPNVFPIKHCNKPNKTSYCRISRRMEKVWSILLRVFYFVAKVARWAARLHRPPTAQAQPDVRFGMYTVIWSLNKVMSYWMVRN